MASCDSGTVWSSDVSYCQIDNMIHYVGAAIFHVSASGLSESQSFLLFAGTRQYILRYVLLALCQSILVAEVSLLAHNSAV